MDTLAPVEDSPQQQKARERMLRQQIVRRGINNARILEAMQHVPRHFFVPKEYQGRAYEDSPLPIGAGQTISQPYIVAYMTQLLQPGPDDRVLEIGVGSGYQTAILAELAGEVVGIERIASLASSAAERLNALGYDRVTIIARDGTLGFPERAPYNGILVAAAGPRIPPSLVEQLTLFGKLIIPVGSNEAQLIKVVEKTPDGVEVSDLTPVRFVPLIGEEGWNE